jgi:hypothetical protein
MEDEATAAKADSECHPRCRTAPCAAYWVSGAGGHMPAGGCMLTSAHRLAPAGELPIPAVLQKKKKINWLGALTGFYFLFAFIFYIAVRCSHTLDLGNQLW